MINIRSEMLDAREKYLNRIKDELIGPGSEISIPDKEHELLSDRPDKRYSVGILFTQNNQMNVENDDTVEETSDNSNDITDEETDEIEETELTEENQSNEFKNVFSLEKYDDSIDDEYRQSFEDSVNLAFQNKPSSFGLTFFINTNPKKINCHLNIASYRKAKPGDCRIPFDSLDGSFDISPFLLSYVKYDFEEKTIKLIDSKIDPQRLRGFNESKDRFSEYEQSVIQAMYQLNNQVSYGYVREPYTKDILIEFYENDYSEIIINLDEVKKIKVTSLKRRVSDEIYSITIMIVNDSEKNEVSNYLFQPELMIKSSDNDFLFVDYHSTIDFKLLSEEDKSLELLYRNKKTYSTGLGSSANWKVDDKGCGEVFSDFMPSFETQNMDYEFSSQYNVDKRAISMKFLSDLDNTPKTDKIEALSSIISAYNKWIHSLEKETESIDNKYKEIALKNIAGCKSSYLRMMNGIEELTNNENAWNSFQLANRAMYMQRIHLDLQNEQQKNGDIYSCDNEYSEKLATINYYECSDEYRWRPFQIAFILMSICSLTNDSSSDKDIVDLIWFPTGGGKTEAYLGLTAFSIFYRRLVFPNECAGTAVIMRYTLRLLTSQQFTRAATLICACEFIRQKSMSSNQSSFGRYRRNKSIQSYPSYQLGNEEITIGLWIGGGHTPNKRIEAEKHYKKLIECTNRTQLSYVFEKNGKFQLLKCPWCGTRMVKNDNSKKIVGDWGYRISKNKRFEFFCPQQECFFNSKLPVSVVDEDLYENPPTLLFGTVDKFAMLPWKSEIGKFFGINTNNRSPELIIQDELHLISGPLGTLVGLYETAIDALCQQKGKKTKIIASTATIRHAKEQCISLYNREINQFPNPGINSEDSFFSREQIINYEKGNYGRLYVGIMPSGKTKAMMEIHAISSITQIIKDLSLEDAIKDKYWTLPIYFGSLKELGKCHSLIDDDVKDAIRRKCRRNFSKSNIRNLWNIEELTSRATTTELNRNLDKLEKNEYSEENFQNKKYPIDVLLCTNMISVGIDVSRLCSMLIVGQPKLTSEYIQASSRIGRSYPGICFTLYDSSKSRDRSHYEQFKSYHSSFYKYVEPTGVTPFSDPARERALHAVVISLIRNFIPELSSDKSAGLFKKSVYSPITERIANYIVQRERHISSLVNPNQTDNSSIIEQEINDIFNHWEDECNKYNDFSYGYKYIMGNVTDSESGRLLRTFNSSSSCFDRSFPTMTSMRNVDVSVSGELIEFEGE